MTPKHFLIRLLSVIMTLCMLLPLCVCAEDTTESSDGLTEPLSAGRDPVAYGIDVSRWQSEVDFQAVKADGIDFVILRIGYWDTKDANFDKYYTDAKAAGLDVGVYIYSYSASVADAAFEAANVLSWIGEKSLEYPVYYDIEDEVQSPLTNKERTALCLEFARVITEAGYLPGVYASENWFKNYLERESLIHLPLWLAKWTKDSTAKPDPGEPYGLWQYTDKGEVDGIKYSVDMDVSYVDYPAYIKENNLNGYVKPVLPNETPYTDISSGAWYYPYVKYTYDMGIMNGMSPTAFAPEVSVSRGMFVTVLGRMSGADTSLYTESPFLDVDMTAYYGPYVCWAYEKGITDGMGRDMFSPDTLITREQMCKMMAGYLAYMGVSLSPATESFTDDESIAGWAKEYVYLLVGGGIINGVAPGVFSPKSDATRAQCAAIIQRINGANDVT